LHACVCRLDPVSSEEHQAACSTNLAQMASVSLRFHFIRYICSHVSSSFSFFSVCLAFLSLSLSLTLSLQAAIAQCSSLSLIRSTMTRCCCCWFPGLISRPTVAQLAMSLLGAW